MTTLRLSYYPDITQGVPAQDVHREIGVFARALGDELTRLCQRSISIDVAPVMDVLQQYEDILRGSCAIALMRPVAYVFAHRRDANVVPACVAFRPIHGQVGEKYFGQIYARAELGLRSIADLAASKPEQLTIAYGSRFSTSNFLVPAYLLQQSGAHPFLFFKSILFAGGHDKAAQKVYEGAADVGAGHDGVITMLAAKYPDAAAKLVSLGHLDIHSDPVVVHLERLGDVSLAQFQQACATIAKTPAVQAALDLFWGWVKDLGPTHHGNYASIEQALAGMHLDEADMLR